MNGNIEELVLSGDFFEEKSSSPPRQHSPSSPNEKRWPHTNSDYDSPTFASDNENGDSDDVLDELDAPSKPKPKATQPHRNIGMQPGRTGVKGVIRDHSEHVALSSHRALAEMKAMNAKMEKASLGGMTYDEEKEFDRENEEVSNERRHFESRGGVNSRFGHLREVGARGFVSSLEGERQGTSVVVHLYDTSLERCARLDLALGLLARQYSHIKFLRIRAAALGFASSSSRSLRKEPEDEDVCHEEEDKVEADTDTDMLPTLLIYRDGDLIHNWVRVDWAIRDQLGKLDMDVEALLERHGVLKKRSGAGRHYSGDDGEDSAGSLEIEFEHIYESD